MFCTLENFESPNLSPSTPTLDGASCQTCQLENKVAPRQTTQKWREAHVYQKVVIVPLLPPEEGHVENLLFLFVSILPLAQWPVVPKSSMKENFPQSLGHTGCSLAVSNSAPPCFLPHPLLFPQAKSLHFEDTLLSYGIHGTGKSHSLLTAFTSGCIASWVAPQWPSSLPFHG